MAVVAVVPVVMVPRVLNNSLVWLCLLVQLTWATTSAAGMVLCVEEDGRVAIETQFVQLACCGRFANLHEGASSEPGLVEEGACIDTPLNLPASLREASARATDGVWPTPTAAPPVATGLPSTAPAHVVRSPSILPPDRTREAISSVVLRI